MSFHLGISYASCKFNGSLNLMKKTKLMKDNNETK